MTYGALVVHKILDNPRIDIMKATKFFDFLAFTAS